MPFLDPGLAVPSRRLSPAVAGRVPAAGRIAALAATRRVAALAATGIAPLAVAFSLAFAPAAAPAQVRPAVLPRPAAELDRAPMDSSAGDVTSELPDDGKLIDEGVIARWFANLNAGDSRVRDAAKAALIGLRRSDLAALKTVVAKSQPLAPTQAAALPDIVTQVFLGGDPYRAGGTDGFLGIQVQETRIGELKEDPKIDPAEARNQPQPGLAQNADGSFYLQPDLRGIYGITVAACMPGFSGARSLKSGDVILGVVERPDLQIRATAEFTFAIRDLKARNTFHFKVLREGQFVTVPVRLDPRPLAADNGTMSLLLEDRMIEALEYWDHDFGSLVLEVFG